MRRLLLFAFAFAFVVTAVGTAVAQECSICEVLGGGDQQCSPSEAATAQSHCEEYTRNTQACCGWRFDPVSGDPIECIAWCTESSQGCHLWGGGFQCFMPPEGAEPEAITLDFDKMSGKSALTELRRIYDVLGGKIHPGGGSGSYSIRSGRKQHRESNVPFTYTADVVNGILTLAYSDGHGATRVTLPLDGLPMRCEWDRASKVRAIDCR